MTETDLETLNGYGGYGYAVSDRVDDLGGSEIRYSCRVALAERRGTLRHRMEEHEQRGGYHDAEDAGQ